MEVENEELRIKNEELVKSCDRSEVSMTNNQRQEIRDNFYREFKALRKKGPQDSVLLSAVKILEAVLNLQE
ncbi:MAG: hypothetical protein ACKO86_24455 [Dolichospermum sp.]